MINRTPKYNVNDIVIVKGISYGSYGYFDNVVGVIKDVFNHRDTGEVFYHIIFNSGTPRKIFEYEIEYRFYTGEFRNGYFIHRRLLVKIYHNKDYKFLSEKVFIEWVYENFDYTTYHTQTPPLYYNYQYDPKFMDVSSMYPVKSSLKELSEEIAKREVKRLDDEIKKEINNMVNNVNKGFGVPGKYYWETALAYKKIIFNGPCTIILWKDGSKTIAKTSGEEEFDPEKGVAICFMKKMLGHTETNKILRKATKQYLEETDKINPPTIQEILKSITDKLSAN